MEKKEKTLHINIFTKKENFVNETVKFIEQLISSSKNFKLAVSGGKTPKPIFEQLNKSKVDFSRVSIFQVDERYMPEKSRFSNFKLVKGTLLKNKKTMKFFPFNVNLPVQKAVTDYEKILKKAFAKNKRTFDLTILGIGPDGHIASLFPKSKALSEKKLTAHTKTNKFDVKDRLTLTYSPILNSDKILVLLKGKEKFSVLRELTQGKKTINSFPAKALLKHRAVYINFLL